MHIGMMDRRITLQSRTVAQDAMGEPDETWSTLATVWAQVVALRADEPFTNSEQHQAKVTHVFKAYHRTDIDTTCRIVYQGDYYNIESVKELGRRQGMELRAYKYGD